MLRDELNQLDTSQPKLRSFGVLVGIVATVLASVLLWKGLAMGWVVLAVGAALIIMGLIAARFLRPLYLPWMTLALLLGFVMTRVVLTAVFFLMITPIGLIMRLTGRDPMRRKIDRSRASYWITKSYDPDSSERLERYY